MFVIFSTFPSCTTTVFPWFPGFSLVQVMFGSTWLNALQINCKLSPSRTVGTPLILVIYIGTKSNQTITSFNFKDNYWMACTCISNVENWYTVDMILKHSLQTLHMQICKWNSTVLWLFKLYKNSLRIIIHYEYFNISAFNKFHGHSKGS